MEKVRRAFSSYWWIMESVQRSLTRKLGSLLCLQGSRLFSPLSGLDFAKALSFFCWGIPATSSKDRSFWRKRRKKIKRKLHELH